jgi:hypothetical protein
LDANEGPNAEQGNWLKLLNIDLADTWTVFCGLGSGRRIQTLTCRRRVAEITRFIEVVGADYLGKQKLNHDVVVSRS